MSGCLMALRVPCNPDTIGSLHHCEPLKYPSDSSAIIGKIEEKWHIWARPRGVLCSYISYVCQPVQLSILPPSNLFTAHLLHPAFCHILCLKSIGLIPWLTYFLHHPDSQTPQEIVNCMKCFFQKCWRVEIPRKLLAVADFWFVYAVFIVSFSLNWRPRHLSHSRHQRYPAAGPAPRSEGLCFLCAGNSQL